MEVLGHFLQSLRALGRSLGFYFQKDLRTRLPVLGISGSPPSLHGNMVGPILHFVFENSTMLGIQSLAGDHRKCSPRKASPFQATWEV